MKNNLRYLVISMCLLLVNALYATNLDIKTIQTKSNTKIYDADEYANLIKKQIKSSNNISSGMIAGMGFSSDRQTIAPVACYKPLTINHDQQSATISLNMSQEASKIANTFNVMAEFKSGIGQFSADGMFNYLNEIEENRYSISLNYYEKISANVNMTYSYNPTTILTDTGKDIYNNGQNPMFRLFCGDTLVTSYEEGAGLMMSLIIKFANQNQKNTFEAQMGGNMGDIFSASAKVQNIANQYHLNGVIELHGYQLGGDPTQLSKMIDEKEFSKCSLTNTASCQALASRLIYYANTEFPNQFQKQDGKWTGPLVPLGGYKKDFNVVDFGMKLAPTYVTAEVSKSRNILMSQNVKNKIILDNTLPILKSYPVPLDPNFRNTIQTIHDNANANNALFIIGTTSGTAIDCWDFPYKCVNITKEINSSLKDTNLHPYGRGSYWYEFENVKQLTNFKGELWPNGSYIDIEEQGIHFPIKIGNTVFTPLEERNWNTFYLIDSSSIVCGALECTGAGTYHDGGSCPFDDNYHFIRDDITPSITLRFTRHIHSAGDCKGDYDATSIETLKYIVNPYYFDI